MNADWKRVVVGAALIVVGLVASYLEVNGALLALVVGLFLIVDAA